MNFYEDYIDKQYRTGASFGNELDEIHDMGRDLKDMALRIEQIALKYKEILNIDSPYYK